jgi:hypothetical protein
MMDIIGRLRSVEAEKRRLRIGSPDFVTLANEAQELSRTVFRWSEIQMQLAEESELPGPSSRTIDDVPNRPLPRILAEWREADLRLQGALPGSTEAQAAAADVERFREEYRRVARESS